MTENNFYSSDDKDLTKRSFKAAGWVLILQFTTQFIQLLIGICMVRLLSPQDYGIIGMLYVFWGVSGVFIRGGFGQALIQRKEITSLDLNSVFYYNMFLSLVCCALMILFSDSIATFYNQEILSKTIKVTAWTLPITAFSAVQLNILNRQLKQYFITISTLVSNLIGGVVAICLARMGYGVWALVWQQFISVLLSTLFVFSFVRWLPSLMFSFRSLLSLFKFGSSILLAELVDSLANNASNMIIGKRYMPAVLGYYTRSKSFAVLWPSSIQMTVGRVVFPAFSKIQDDIPRLKSAFRRALVLSVFAIVFPALLLSVLCKPFILVVLGDKWLPCVPYWWLISLSVLFLPMQELNIQILKARGRSDLYLLIEIIKKFSFVIQVVILLMWGIFPMLFFEIVQSVFYFFLNSFFNGRDISYGMLLQFRDTMPYFMISLFSCLLSWCLYKILFLFSGLAGLFVPAMVGLLVYLFLNRLFKTSAFMEFVKLISLRFPFVSRLFFM